jgi:hypothetical protein
VVSVFLPGNLIKKTGGSFRVLVRFYAVFTLAHPPAKFNANHCARAYEENTSTISTTIGGGEDSYYNRTK